MVSVRNGAFHEMHSAHREPLKKIGLRPLPQQISCGHRSPKFADFGKPFPTHPAKTRRLLFSRADRERIAAWLPDNWQRGTDPELERIVFDELNIDTTAATIKFERLRLGLLRTQRIDGYVPTAEQIVESAAVEREHWSDEEHYVRAGQPVPAWLRRPREVHEGYQFPDGGTDRRRNGREM